MGSANKIDLVQDEEAFRKFLAAVEAKGYQVYPICAPIHQGIPELLSAISSKLAELPDGQPEEALELFDEDKLYREDEDYREIYVRRENRVFILSGKQLEKIFNSTNFNDQGSLRYLYKYIESKGAIERMQEMGLEEGDLIRIRDYEFEYLDD